MTSRRTLLGVALAGGLAALPTAPARAASAADPSPHGGPPPGPAPDRDAALHFVDLMLDAYRGGDAVRLPQSHADQVGLFSTGFTYDAAVALLAYLATGTPGRVAQAQRIGAGLLYAQQHDPDFHDGRLR